MLKIKDFGIKNSYINLIKNRIIKDLWDTIYKPLFNAISLKAENDINNIINAISEGKIYYEDGGFKARAKFTNAISTDLIKLGAKYSKYNKAYMINLNDLPNNILNAITTREALIKERLNIINDLLGDIQNNLDSIIETFVYTSEVMTILDDTGKEMSIIAKKINVIEPELSYEQKQEIAKTYTNNMNYYIKGWANDRISEMREKVRIAILDGYREEQVRKMLINEYSIAKNKANFLAHNETSIVLSEIKKTMYQDMGFEYFIWKTRMDGREREEHKELNNTIWRFDDPPTIVTKDGRITKGLPGSIDYNCRCNFIPIRPDSAFVTNEFQRSDDLKKIRKYVLK